MEIIQEIGSYAGFAAVLGLAVLSALYFSQARDVKRLREWAGRAPERGPQPAQPSRVVAQPITRPAPPAAAPPPVPRPPGAVHPAQAASTGAAPAVATGPAPATPAAAKAPAASGETDTDTDQQVNPDAEVDEDVTAMNTVVHPPPEAPDEDELDDGATGDGDDEESSEDTGEWTPEDEHSEYDFTDEHDAVPAATPAARPPQPPRPFPRGPGGAVPASRAGRSKILPAYHEIHEPERESDRRGISRKPVLLAIGGLVALAIGAFALTQVLGGDDSTPDEPAGLASSTSDSNPNQPVDPSSVTVAVLNGTTVPGLAATLGDKIAAEGFRLGTVTNNFDQERAESVVLYAPDAEREAIDVSRRLDIPQRETIDADSQSLAGDATVVVVAGADQTQ